MTDYSRLNWHDLHALAVRLAEQRDVALNECCRLQYRRGILVESVRDALRELDRKDLEIAEAHLRRGLTDTGEGVP